jgi:hypothetical protein
MYILIGLGVLVIAALVVAYLSSKTWHWGQVVLVFFLFLASIGYAVLAADVLRKHNQVRSEYHEVSAELARLTSENEVLLYGGDDRPGIRELEKDLGILVRARGPVWRDIAHGRVNPQTGAVPITFRPAAPPPPADEFAAEPAQPQAPAPAPLAGLEVGTIVFAFEQPPPGAPVLGQYLGEFQVTERNGPEATIQPVLRQSWAWPRGEQIDRRIRQLGESQLPWVLYDTMPADSYAVFAGISEEQLRALIPPDAVEQYLRHGQVVGEEVDPRLKAPFTSGGQPLTTETMADVPAADVQWRFQRPLRDYSLLFQTIARKRIEQFAEYDALLSDIQLLEDARKSAEALQSARREEIKKLEHDLAGFSQDADAIEKHVEALKSQLEEVNSRIRELEETTRQKASELAQAQLQIMQQLDGSTTGATATNGAF